MFSEFASRVFVTLQQMEREAVAMIGGRPCGLQAFQHSAVATNRHEEACFRGLADRLGCCEIEVRYPGTRRRCDMVVATPDGGRLWMEAKGAWKDYFWEGDTVRNGAFRVHLHWRARHDVDKLACLKQDMAQHVGMLLLGFDIESNPMADDVAAFAAAAGLSPPVWHAFDSHWPDPHVTGHHSHAWLWLRSVPQFEP